MTAPERRTEESFRLDGLVVLVTGASQNIGLAISSACARAGADVVMVARSEGRLNEAVEMIRLQSPDRRIEPYTADIASSSGVEDILDYCSTAFETIDVLVNNAASVGNTGGLPILDATEASWEECIATNLLGPFRLCQGLCQSMISSGRGGSVINIISGSGFQPMGFNGPYGTTKAALWMLTRYLAREYAPLLRANAVCPGIISPNREPRNDIGQAILDSGAIPLARLGGPEEVAPAVVYLASPAASYVTGEVLFVNGGLAW